MTAKGKPAKSLLKVEARLATACARARNSGPNLPAPQLVHQAHPRAVD